MDQKEHQHLKIPSLLGNTNGHHSTKESVTTLHASTIYLSCEETLQKFWAREEPPKPKVPVSPADKFALEHYNQHLKHEENGRFVVKLPFKPQKSNLGESRPLALRRFLSLERRFRSSDQFENYANVIYEYIFSGHAKRVPDNDLNEPLSNTFYLAHHAVYKDSATTPLRVVFNGSMKTTSGVLTISFSLDHRNIPHSMTSSFIYTDIHMSLPLMFQKRIGQSA